MGRSKHAERMQERREKEVANAQFWWVVDWLLCQSQTKVNDELLDTFVADVEEEDFPTVTKARFFLRQLRRVAEQGLVLAEQGRKGGEKKAGVAEVLLESLAGMAEDASHDADYGRGAAGREGLAVPDSLWGLCSDAEKSAASLPAFLTSVKEYAVVASANLGPCHIQTVAWEQVGSQGGAMAAAPAEAEEEAIEDIQFDLDKAKAKPGRPGKRRAATAAGGRGRRLRKKMAAAAEEEEEASLEVDDAEVEAHVQRLKESRSNLRAIGTDPLQEILKQASQAKRTDGVVEEPEEENAAAAMASGGGGRGRVHPQTRGVAPAQTRHAKAYERHLLNATDSAEEDEAEAEKEAEAEAEAEKEKENSDPRGDEEEVEEEHGAPGPAAAARPGPPGGRRKKQPLLQRQADAKTVGWDAEDDEIELSGPLKSPVGAMARGTNANANAGQREIVSKTGRRKARRWTEAEAELLVDLVQKFGKGRWKTILLAGQEEGKFQGRTGVDLKDKYRNLETMAAKIEVEGL